MMITFWKKASDIQDRIFIPKFYDPGINEDRRVLAATHTFIKLGDLVRSGKIEVATGDEIGKSSYGTGDIPFVRTSDISNWETKSAPKQGVSQTIYNEYVGKQDVRAGDILLVRDGTYLIGTNCFVTQLDSKMLYQSHILKFRVIDTDSIDPHILFLALNSRLVRRQIRSFQFTADTIDTIGHRYLDLVISVPQCTKQLSDMTKMTKIALESRVRGKSFVKQAPTLMEEALRTNSANGLEQFVDIETENLQETLRQDTVTAEFGHFETFWQNSALVRDRILLPKYYDPEIIEELVELEKHCDCVSIGDLINREILEFSSGDEIGKMAYGTGDIPFLRTSDFANWEIKHDPKQGVSQEIYDEYAASQDLRAEDILIVRDGTYLIGTSCMVSEEDTKALFCGGLIKIRSLDKDYLDPHLLLALLNSYIVKRQIRTKQFTRDVIDTIGQRLKEVVLPIPRSTSLRGDLTSVVKRVIDARISSRKTIASLSFKIDNNESVINDVDVEDLEDA
jgi:hypothetical protein